LGGIKITGKAYFIDLSKIEGPKVPDPPKNPLPPDKVKADEEKRILVGQMEYIKRAFNCGATAPRAACSLCAACPKNPAGGNETAGSLIEKMIFGMVAVERSLNNTWDCCGDGKEAGRDHSCCDDGAIGSAARTPPNDP
jgi:hypothetical protein